MCDMPEGLVHVDADALGLARHDDDDLHVLLWLRHGFSWLLYRSPIYRERTGAVPAWSRPFAAKPRNVQSPPDDLVLSRAVINELGIDMFAPIAKASTAPSAGEPHTDRRAVVKASSGGSA
jgi:hypothetical protein